MIQFPKQVRYLLYLDFQRIFQISYSKILLEYKNLKTKDLQC